MNDDVPQPPSVEIRKTRLLLKALLGLACAICISWLAYRAMPDASSEASSEPSTSTYSFSTNLYPAVDLKVDATQPLPPLEENLESRYRPMVSNPFPISSGKTLFLYGNGMYSTYPPTQKKTYAVIGEIVDWNSNTVSTLDWLHLPARRNQQDYLMRYALTSNQSGVWAVGPVIALLQPDGSVVQTEFESPPAPIPVPASKTGMNPLAAALDDGSLLAFSKLTGDEKGHIFRITLGNKEDQPALAIRELPNGPTLQGGTAVTKLADGRVLLVGGMYYFEKRAQLFDPKTETWSETGSTNLRRTDIALLALPDGRAVVFGASQSDNNEEHPAGNTAEIWNPVNGKWTLLPPLPLSYRLDAYGTEAPSATSLPDGSLIVAGGAHPHIVMLKKQGNSFAPGWSIVGNSSRRMGGIIQALSNTEVVVSGGKDNAEGGACCWDRRGGDRVAWNAEDPVREKSIVLDRTNAAVAHRGTLSFAAGGIETFSSSFGSARTQASAVAELIDNVTGQIRDLPQLPDMMFSGKATWLDDDHVLVKATAKIDLDSRTIEGVPKGYLAVLDLKSKVWKTNWDNNITNCQFAGMRNIDAVLLCPDSQAFLASTKDLSLHTLPKQISVHSGEITRVLPDGRIVVAGGLSQPELLEAIDPNCNDANCPLESFARGIIAPSSRYEYLDASFNPRWHISAASQGIGSSAVIRNDGRVIKLGFEPSNGDEDANKHNLYLEQSHADGSKWERLPLPPSSDIGDYQYAPCGGDDRSKTCFLLGTDIPHSNKTVVLLVQRLSTKANKYDVFALNDQDSGWVYVARELDESQLDDELTLPFQSNNKPLHAAHLRPGQLLIWQDKSQ